jgi:hypothetical protein
MFIIICAIIAILSCGLGVFGIAKCIDGLPQFVFSVFVLNIIFGFCFLCADVKVKDLPDKYINPDNIIQNENAVVAIKDGVTFLSEKAIDVNKAKDGFVKIKVVTGLNSYGKEILMYKDMRILSKEEWEKIENEN